jgi:hypothetical protein
MALLAGPTRNIIEQDPDDILDYVADFGHLLVGDDIINGISVLATGVTVASFAYNAAPITIDEYGTLPIRTAVVFWLTGGTVGVPGKVRVRIVSAAGRSYDVSYEIVLKQR